MPILFSKTEVIAKPLETVWSFLTDPSNMVHIMPDVISSEQIGNEPIGVGTRIKETRKVLNKEATAEVEVSIYKPPQRFGIKSESMGISAEYVYTLSKNAGGTTVNLDATMHTRGLAKLIAPLFRSSMKKQDSEQLHLLKTYLENGVEA